jgi:hypothetical protein
MKSASMGIHAAADRVDFTLSHPSTVTSLRFKCILGLIVIGIFFNNILRWFPFPEGRSANDLSTLDDTIYGIVVNLTTIACILLLILFERSTRRFSVHSALLVSYCTYIAAQAAFRDHAIMEILRAASWILMLLSADLVGSVLCSTPTGSRLFIGTLFWSLVATTALGLGIAAVLPGSVNWGLGISNSYTQSARGEFFFLWIPPVLTAALSTCYLGKASSTGPKSRAMAILILTAASALCTATLTRTYVFGIILVLSLILFARTRYAWVAISAACILVFVLVPELFFSLMTSLRIYVDPSVDFTNGRNDLNAFLLDLFSQSPLFGVGAQEMRDRIAHAKTYGFTEHGYTSHLASYGIFALLFFGYMIYGAISSANLLFVTRRNRTLLHTQLGIDATAAASLSIFTIVSGFVGLLGAASSFGDWLGIVFVSMTVGLNRQLLASLRKGNTWTYDCTQEPS